MRYEDFFKQAFGREPYEFQSEMAEGELPSIVGAPTGAGKTAAALGAWLWRRLDHNRSSRQSSKVGGCCTNQLEKVGRRLIYCLPMRVLVEQTAKVAREAIRRLEAELSCKGASKVQWAAMPQMLGTTIPSKSKSLREGKRKYDPTRI
ncbi:MAG: DEAD/DEAH box helicase [Acidobacteria bacterium]|nr:MAG: DEAD/DEAH box helicase [Acidobacteriota bacterium]